MARVICRLPNASTEINGVRFTEDRGEMISDEITAELADAFASIPGFHKIDTPAPEPQATAETGRLADLERENEGLRAELATAKTDAAQAQAQAEQDLKHARAELAVAQDELAALKAAQAEQASTAGQKSGTKAKS